MRRTIFTSAATVAALATATVVPTGNAAEIAPHHLGDDGRVVCEVKLTGKEDKHLQRFTLDTSTAFSSALIAVVEEQHPGMRDKGEKLLRDERIRLVFQQVLRGEEPNGFDLIHLKTALTFNGFTAFNQGRLSVMMLYLGALVLRDDPALFPPHILWDGGAPGLIYADEQASGSNDAVNDVLDWIFDAVPYESGDLDNLRAGLKATPELARIDAEAAEYSAVLAAARNACNAQDTVRIEFPGSPRPNKPAPTTTVQTTTAPTTPVQTTTVANAVPSTTTTAEATTSKATTSTAAPKPTTKPAPSVSSATTTRAETPKSTATVAPSTTSTVAASPSRAPETTTAVATTTATATATLTATETNVSTVVNTTRVPVPTTVTTPVTTKATTETTAPVVTTTPTATPTTTETTETPDTPTPEEQPEGSSEAGKVVGIVFGVLGALGLIVAAVLAFGPDIEVKVTF